MCDMTCMRMRRGLGLFMYKRVLFLAPNTYANVLYVVNLTNLAYLMVLGLFTREVWNLGWNYRCSQQVSCLDHTERASGWSSTWFHDVAYGMRRDSCVGWYGGANYFVMGCVFVLQVKNGVGKFVPSFVGFFSSLCMSVKSLRHLDVDLFDR